MLRLKVEDSSMKMLMNGLNNQINFVLKILIQDNKLKQTDCVIKKNFNFSMISSVKSYHDKEVSNDSILQEICKNYCKSQDNKIKDDEQYRFILYI